MSSEIRNDFCSDCDLGVFAENICISSQITGREKILVVGEYPTVLDDLNGTVMGAQRDRILFEVLEEVCRVNLSLFHFSYLVRCKPKAGYKPSSFSINSCYKYLEREIEMVNPKVIITLGDMVLKKIVGKSGITRLRGSIQVIKINDNEYKVLPAYSTAYVESNGEFLKDFAFDLQRAYEISIGKDNEIKKCKSILCKSVDSVRQLIGYIREVGMCSFDFETVGLDVHSKDFKVTLLSLSFQHGSSYSIPLDHFDTPFSDNEKAEIIKLLHKEIFNNVKIRKVAHNLKFDLQVARHCGIYPFRGRLDDTMLMHHLLDETKSAGLKNIVAEYFPMYNGYDDEVKNYKWDEVPLEELSNYAGMDADFTMRLCTLFESFLLKDVRVYKVYRNLSIPALKVLAEMEWDGMLIDRGKLLEYITEAKKLHNDCIKKMKTYKQVIRFENSERKKSIDKEIEKVMSSLEKAKVKARGKTRTIEKLEKKLQQLKSGEVVCYTGINFQSNVQLKNLLYEKEGFNIKPLEEFGTHVKIKSTAKDVLVRLKDKTGFIKEILIFRSIGKILSTYLEGLYSKLDENDRVHTSFLQHGTASGRLSSRNPNLQNIPSVSKLDSDLTRKVVGFVKEVFVAPKGHYLVQVDYAQAELRVLASFANEGNMLEAYNTGKDLHVVTASNMLGRSIDQFYELDLSEQKVWRTRAKAGNFGLAYGMGVKGFKEYARSDYGIDLSDKEADKFHSDFFKLYPKLTQYYNEYIGKGRKFGYVRTLFGRKRICLDINSMDSFKRSMAERIAINSPIQGTVGEFTIFTLALLYDRLGEDIKIVNTVHDSILFYVPKEKLTEAIKIISDTCCSLPTKKYFGKDLSNVGMVVDVELSEDNWGSLRAEK